MIFDTHAHYDSLQFHEDREDVFRQIRMAGVDRVANISNGWEDMLRSLEMVQQFNALRMRDPDGAAQLPVFYGTVGIHPSEIRDLNEERFAGLYDLCAGTYTEPGRSFCGNEDIVAIGEIGLDYYWPKRGADEAIKAAEAEGRDIAAEVLQQLEQTKEEQRYWFRRQLTLAKEVGLPVVIHSRDASQDTFDLMKEVHAGTTGGIIHCYSGSVEMAREYVKLGYYLGIGGVVTYKNAKVLKNVVADTPLSRLVLETDCPYLTPTPHRGKRNCSAYLTFVADTIAELKGITREEVEEVTYQNAMEIYHIG